MNEYLIRVITRDGSFRGLAAVTSGIAQTLCTRFDAWPTAAVALGRALTCGALMGGLLKGDQRIGLKFEGNGPLGKIIVEADADGAIRGSLGNPHVNITLPDGRQDVAAALGRAGFLTVTRDLGMGEPYKGLVQLATSEIGADLAYYLTDSEQIPSAVGVGVALGLNGVAVAGGFLLQAMPPQDDARIEMLMERIAELPPISDLLSQGETPEMLIQRLLASIPFDILEVKPLRFECSCSRAKIEHVLLAFGPDELSRMAADPAGVTVTCEFCREEYSFSPDALHSFSAG